ncbi:MAG: hypothetical protein AAFX99_11905 [Myxococcota bacterium]
MSNTELSALRALMHNPPSPAGWVEICRLLLGSEPGAYAVARNYVVEHLERWSDAHSTPEQPWSAGRLDRELAQLRSLRAQAMEPSPQWNAMHTALLAWSERELGPLAWWTVLKAVQERAETWVDEEQHAHWNRQLGDLRWLENLVGSVWLMRFVQVEHGGQRSYRVLLRGDQRFGYCDYEPDEVLMEEPVEMELAPEHYMAEHALAGAPMPEFAAGSSPPWVPVQDEGTYVFDGTDAWRVEEGVLLLSWTHGSSVDRFELPLEVANRLDGFKASGASTQVWRLGQVTGLAWGVRGLVRTTVTS